MSKTKLPKWDEERTNNLVAIVGDSNSGEVSIATVDAAAEALATTSRSIASKLRKLGYDVEVKNRKKTFSEEEEAQLKAFVEANEGVFTAAEVASQLFNDVNRAKQIQGKLLSMDMSSFLKKVEPKEFVRSFSTEEEQQILELLGKEDVFMEDIATALNREVDSVRGKILSMIKTHNVEKMPKQREYVSNAKTDKLSTLENIASKTIADIAEEIGKTERGVKVMLTHRGIKCADYDGEARARKNADKREAAKAQTS